MIPVVVSAFVGAWLAVQPFVMGGGMLFEIPLGVGVVAASLLRIRYPRARWVSLAIGVWFIVAPVLVAGRIPWPVFAFDVAAGVILVMMAVPYQRWRDVPDRHAMSGF